MDDQTTPWQPSATQSLPETGEIHVWCIRLDCPAEQVARWSALLAPDELERAARYRVDEVRREYVVGRGTLRALLGGYLRIEPRQVEFEYGPRGRPALAGRLRGHPLNFNLSNARDLALAAFVNGRGIGVDLESNRRRVALQDVAGRFFSPAECAALFALPEDLQRQGFLNAWTRKEAYLKARGTGLARPLDRFEVSLAPGEPARLLKDTSDPGAEQRWSLVALEGLPGYTAALAVEGRPRRLRCFDFLMNPEHL
jgi:4'-phosphopantetheinyl transferase